MTTRTAHTNDAALEAYTVQIARMQDALALLQAYADQGVVDVAAPEDIHWGHVGSLADAVKKLEDVVEWLGA